jgi:ElaB/YqjD/DUF883 family membrane-anchored ribosome-binding protein
MIQNDTAARLQSDLAAVMSDAEALLLASTQQDGDRLNEARDRIRESLEAVRKRLLDVERSALHQGEDAMRATEQYVRHNPWQSIGIAAGIGLLVGALLARR